MNEKTIHTLELHKILEQLASYTTFSAAADLANALRPSRDIEQIQTWQRETAEARALFENQVNVSMGGARDVREAALLAQRGIMIEPQVLLDVRYTLRRATTIKRTLGRMRGQYPLLSDLINQAEECTEIQEEIARVLDDNAVVKDSASPQLAMIRRDLKIAFDRLQQRLQRIVSSKNNQPALQESLVTMRNGRYVVPLKADYKGRIPGIVHDASSSGATLFIEPLETVELNNRWRELQLNEDKEIRRILSVVTEMVGREADFIVHTVTVLAYLDLVLAKARYADALNAVQPTLKPFEKRQNIHHPGSTISITAGRHPLLTGNVVPIDVEFDENTWILVVTGPNTGGKTVSLKTVGLFCLMAQSGLHVPAEQATLTPFEGVYADIGDEQSIEQSLSTFSSHMTNTIQILKECDERSLVLLDELGAGTDPAEGSALARAILTHLLYKSVTTMVTTHHPELKIYSVETAGVRNASVEFDLETLSPTYRLMIGLPGRSNALAIATRLGLDPVIIEEARSMVATEDLIADDLLDEIHRTREDIRKQQAQISTMRQEIESERGELAARLSSSDDERRNIIAAARREMQSELDTFKREMRKIRNDMRTASLPLEALKQVQDATTSMENLIQQPIESSVEIPVEVDWIPRLGDRVWLETLKSEGVVAELNKDEAIVQIGSLKVRAKMHDLKKPRKEDALVARRRRTSAYEPTPEVSIPRPASPGLELDLRGARVEEALTKLDDYIDAAYLSGLPFARIIHGKGTGALRKAVQERLREHSLIARAVPAEAKEGGDGVTVIFLASNM